MTRRRPPLPPATGLVVAGLVVLGAAVPGAWWLARTPWVGVELARDAEGAFVVSAVEPGSTAQTAGVRVGDAVRSAGGVDPASLGPRDPATAFSLALKNRYDAGDTLRWHLGREGASAWVRGPVRGLPFPLVASHLLLYVPFLVVALFLGWLRRDDARARRLVYAILALVAGNFLRPATEMALDRPLGVLVQQVCALGRFFGPALLVHWAATFPAPTLPRPTERRVVRVAYLVPLILLVVEEVVLLQGMMDPAAPYLLYAGALQDLGYFRIRFAVFLGAVLGAAVLLVRASLKTQGRERRQVRWVVWSAAAVAVTDTSLVLASFVLTGGYSDITLGPLRNGLYMILAGGLLVAILRDDLFDIDRVIWESGLYFLTTGLAFVTFAVMEEALSSVLSTVWPNRSTFTATALSGVLAAAAFHPVRKTLDQILARAGVTPPESAP